MGAVERRRPRNRRVATPIGVAELHELLRGAVRQAGLEHLWVTESSPAAAGAEVRQLELVEHQPDATTVRAVLHVGAFPRESPR